MPVRAEVVRFRFSKETVEKLLAVAWWDWPLETLKERVEYFYKPIQEFLATFAPASDLTAGLGTLQIGSTVSIPTKTFLSEGTRDERGALAGLLDPRR